MAECEGNASPPSANFDFDVGRVGNHQIYLTPLGKPCQYMNILHDICEDAFISPSDSEETELSSDESISSKGSSKLGPSIPPASAGGLKIKEEKLSDSDTLESKTKSKSSKKSPPKAKKKQVVDYSDSDDSGDDKRKSRRKKYSNDSDDERIKSSGRKKDYSEDRHKHRRKKYSSSSDEDRSQSRRKKSPCRNFVKKEEEEEREYKYSSGVTAAFGNFHCTVCDIGVNSEVTFNTHLQGKRHQKALKLKSVPDIVAQSLKESRLPPRAQTPAAAAAPVAAVKKGQHVPMRTESLIQRTAEDYRDGPLPGLDDVVEVRPPHEGVRDISYICKLCEAQCVPNSIMKHLTGFKHYLRCLEKIDSKSYERYRYTPKRQIEDKVRKILLDDEKRRGRGRIRVEREATDNYSRRDEPGPSWREDRPSPPVFPKYNDDDDVQYVSAVEHLDTSMSDFYCKACDAHMNNQAMWESHVRGKRHLKNIKKVPGESTSKIKSVQCTGETAHLMRIIEELEDKDEYGNDIVIVGLGFLKETQNEAGHVYNCFLCGACTSSFDIIDHLNQTKHKTKYLEEMNAKGYPNGIEQIKAFSGFSPYSKDCMINDECRKCLENYGDGKIAVYKDKNMFTPSSGHRL